MLTPDEEILVVDLLVGAVATAPSPRAVLCIPLMATEFPTRLRTDIQTSGLLVQEAVRLCLLEGLFQQPTWLEILLTSLVPQVLELQPILARLRNPPPLPPDRLEALVLATDMPFLNRRELRKRLRVLREPNTLKPILVVSGPRQSGKTYSTMLIGHFCGGQDSLLHCHVPLQAGMEEITGPKEIARDLVAQLGRSVISMPPDNTNEDRWTRDLAIWVLSEAVATPQNWWFVLDGFSGNFVRPDARKFIVHLTDLVTRGIFARRCRVILLDFDRTALSVQPGQILLEEIESVEQDEIIACVDAILKRAGQSADVQQIASSILQGLPTDDTRMAVLNQRLVGLLEAAEAIHV